MSHAPTDTDSDSDSHVAHGDAFQLLADLPDDHADAAVIDYPWEFEANNGTDRFGFDQDRHDDAQDVMFSMADDDAVPELIDRLTRVVVDGGWILFFADDRFQDVVRDALQADDVAVFRRNWAWTHGRMGMGYYGRVAHYPIPVATVGDTDRYVRGRKTLFQVDGRAESDYPTAKPVALYRDLLAPPVVPEGGRLLEPFCGSAPGAAVAGERPGVDYWACDVNPEAVATAREKYREARADARHEQATL